MTFGLSLQIKPSVAEIPRYLAAQRRGNFGTVSKVQAKFLPHHGCGRNVHPVNFNKEIFLHFNLPSLHIMKTNLIPEIVKYKVEIERKKFVSKTERKIKLKFDVLSSSVGNFKVKEKVALHLPLTLFKF